MKRSNIVVLFVVVFIVALVPTGQAQSPIDRMLLRPDTAKVFTLENFYQLVTQHHPIAKQASLLSDMAKQEIRLARGNFDPKAELQLLTKDLNNDAYYSLLNGSLKFPTASPIEPIVGVQKNTGQYLNPENYISDEFNYRQLYAGFAIPLGRGLITDERRTALKQAQLFSKLTEAEQIKMINKLLLDASYDYWNWFYSYYNYQLLIQSAQIATQVFQRVKVNTLLGEASVVDTVQAFITVQQRLIEQREAYLDFQNTGLVISNYLWDDQGNPLVLDNQWIPVLPDLDMLLSGGVLTELREQALANHPQLQLLTTKLAQLEVDRKLAVENLKPRIDLKYYTLNQPFNPNGETSFVLNDNYKFGLDFSFPIFIRSQRAKYNQAKIKINTIQLERSLERQRITNQINASYNTLIATNAIINQQSTMVTGYERLLQAEFINLENGESDLFKINIQQEKLISAQSKLLKLVSDYEKQKALLLWASGIRNLRYEDVSDN
jgi:outer membrane protein TolC